MTKPTAIKIPPSRQILRRAREREGYSREDVAQIADVSVNDIIALEESDDGKFRVLERAAKALGCDLGLIYSDGRYIESSKSIVTLLLEYNDIWERGLKLKSPVPSSVLFQLQLYEIGQDGYLTTAAVDMAAQRLQSFVIVIRRF